MSPAFDIISRAANLYFYHFAAQLMLYLFGKRQICICAESCDVFLFCPPPAVLYSGMKEILHFFYPPRRLLLQWDCDIVVLLYCREVLR